MNILPHDIPKPKPEPVRVYNQKSGKVGRKPTYDWEHWAPIVKGMTITQARNKIGCSFATALNAWNRGWIDLTTKEPYKHDWDSVAKIAPNYTTVELSKKTGIPYSTILEAKRKGRIKCKEGKKNQWSTHD